MKALLVVLICSLAVSAQAETKNTKLAEKLPAKAKTTPAPAPENTDVAVSPVLSSYQSELYEIRKVEDAAREAAMTEESTSRANADLERQITQRKQHVESLKSKREQLATDIKMMQSEVADYERKLGTVQGDYTKAEEQHENFLQTLDSEKGRLDTSRASYEAALNKLNADHERTQKAINANLMTIHKSKMEVANLTTTIQALESQVAQAEADEMKSRAEFMSLKAQTEDRKIEKAKKIAMLSEQEKKFQVVLQAQKSAQMELASIEKSLAETNFRVANEIRKLDEQTLVAQRSKIMADTNKLRVEAEIDKLKTYAAMVKKANAEMIAAERDSTANLMSAQVALEAAKSELGLSVASGEQMGYRRTKHEAEIRSIASVESSDAVMTDGRAYVIKTACQIRSGPRSASASLGDVTPGQKIAAAPGPGDWMKVLSMGRKAFIRKECGNWD